MSQVIVEWRKYYEDAVSQEKTESKSIVLLGGETSAAAPQPAWNTVGARPTNKSSHPWGTQNSNSSISQIEYFCFHFVMFIDFLMSYNGL